MMKFAFNLMARELFSFEVMWFSIEEVEEEEQSETPKLRLGFE